ncbi:TolC family protein [Thermoflavifilum thermophilum]|uniref:Outer membrane efflux protein n=1 Tax=Thermoflavifilum thermophilum TaxID=1393122 RepID=A0A1I7NE53_9BACT|nr:TolC family protein [Thermoflavifilum thermophilum]SFV32958.1 Outer membrane efflux protein [Thermoflavifilum thermophilum]
MKIVLRLFILIIGLNPILLFGQQNTQQGSNNIIYGIYIPEDDPVAKQLVLLALENADAKSAELQVEAANEQLKLAKTDWWNNVALSGNINEYSISPPKNLTNIYYPRYNFGGTIPLGIFTTHAHKVRQARKELEIAQMAKLSKFEEIKTNVLSKYQDYLMYKQQLTIETSVVENLYNTYLQAEQKFRNGQISVDEYNNALQSYNEELSKKISLQRDLNVSKLEIERLIGVPLENVLRAVNK